MNHIFRKRPILATILLAVLIQETYGAPKGYVRDSNSQIDLGRYTDDLDCQYLIANVVNAYSALSLEESLSEYLDSCPPISRDAALALTDSIRSVHDWPAPMIHWATGKVFDSIGSRQEAVEYYLRAADYGASDGDKSAFHLLGTLDAALTYLYQREFKRGCDILERIDSDSDRVVPCHNFVEAATFRHIDRFAEEQSLDLELLRRRNFEIIYALSHWERFSVDGLSVRERLAESYFGDESRFNLRNDSDSSRFLSAEAESLFLDHLLNDQMRALDGSIEATSYTNFLDSAVAFRQQAWNQIARTYYFIALVSQTEGNFVRAQAAVGSSLHFLEINELRSGSAYLQNTDLYEKALKLSLKNPFIVADRSITHDRIRNLIFATRQDRASALKRTTHLVQEYITADLAMPALRLLYSSNYCQSFYSLVRNNIDLLRTELTLLNEVLNEQSYSLAASDRKLLEYCFFQGVSALFSQATHSHTDVNLIAHWIVRNKLTRLEVNWQLKEKFEQISDPLYETEERIDNLLISFTRQSLAVVEQAVSGNICASSSSGVEPKIKERLVALMARTRGNSSDAIIGNSKPDRDLFVLTAWLANSLFHKGHSCVASWLLIVRLEQFVSRGYSVADEANIELIILLSKIAARGGMEDVAAAARAAAENALKRSNFAPTTPGAWRVALASSYYVSGRYQSALEQIRIAHSDLFDISYRPVTHLDETGGDRFLIYASSTQFVYMRLFEVDILSRLGRQREAAELMVSDIDELQQLISGYDGLALAVVKVRLGDAHAELGDPQQAQHYYQSAWEIIRQLGSLSAYESRIYLGDISSRIISVLGWSETSAPVRAAFSNSLGNESSRFSSCTGIGTSLHKTPLAIRDFASIAIEAETTTDRREAVEILFEIAQSQSISDLTFYGARAAISRQQTGWVQEALPMTESPVSVLSELNIGKVCNLADLPIIDASSFQPPYGLYIQTAFDRSQIGNIPNARSLDGLRDGLTANSLQDLKPLPVPASGALHGAPHSLKSIEEKLTLSESFIMPVWDGSDGWIIHVQAAQKSEVSSIDIPRHEFSAIVEEMRSEISEPNLPQAEIQDSAFRVAASLELRKVRSTLYIAADPLFTKIPFAFLPIETGDSRRTHHLIEETAPIFVASVGALLRAKRTSIELREPELLIKAFGNPYFLPQACDGVHGEPWLCPIPETDFLIETLTRLFYGSVEASTGHAFSKSNFFSMSESRKDYSILLMATHSAVAGSRFRQIEVAEPSLVFSMSAAGPSLLSASEIRELEFDFDLAILAGCNTANAGYPDRYFPAGRFADAFMRAGVPALLLTQWDVSADATSALIVEFLRSLQNSSSIKMSELGGYLAEAQRRMLFSESGISVYRLPRYWASLHLVIG